MKFIKIHDNRTGIDYSWMADVQSLEDFIELEQTWCNRNANCIMDFLQSKDYSNLINDNFQNANFPRGEQHCAPWNYNTIQPFLRACVLNFPEQQKIYPMLYFV